MSDPDVKLPDVHGQPGGSSSYGIAMPAIPALQPQRQAQAVDVARIKRLVNQLHPIPLTYLVAAINLVAAIVVALYYAIDLGMSTKTSSFNSVSAPVTCIFGFIMLSCAIAYFSNVRHKLAEAEDPDLPVGEREALRNETKYRVLVYFGLVVAIVFSTWIASSIDDRLVLCELYLGTSVLLQAILSRYRSNALKHIAQLSGIGLSPDQYALMPALCRIICCCCCSRSS